MPILSESLVRRARICAATILGLVMDGPRTRDRRNSAPTTRLSDEFLSELSSMGPWIYHNRLPGDPGFQRKMDRLRKR